MKSLKRARLIWTCALAFLKIFLPSEAHAWNTSIGMADSGLAQSVRTNPASIIGTDRAVQTSARYSTVTGGPILGFDFANLIQAGEHTSFGAGAEYSLSTSNPEIHIAGTHRFSTAFRVGATSALRKTSSVWQTSTGLFTQFSPSSGGSTFATSLTRIGRGAKTMELTAAVAQRSLLFTQLDGELDVIYRSAAQAFIVKPGIRYKPVTELSLLLNPEVPLQAPGAYWIEAGLAYETAAWSAQLSASTNLTGSAQFALRL